MVFRGENRDCLGERNGSVYGREIGGLGEMNRSVKGKGKVVFKGEKRECV